MKLSTENLKAGDAAAAGQWPGQDYRVAAGDDLQRLEAWFNGRIAITRQEAHRLLESAVASGRLFGRRAEHVAAIKALAAGPGSWVDMGFKILPDA